MFDRAVKVPPRSKSLQGCLSVVTPAQIEAFSWWSKVRAPRTFLTMIGEMSIRCAPVNATASGRYLRVVGHLNGGTVTVALPLAMFDDLPAPYDEGFDALLEPYDDRRVLDALDARLVVLCLTHIFGPVIDQYGGSFRLDAATLVSARTIDGAGLLLTVGNSGPAHPVFVAASETAGTALSDLFAQDDSSDAAGIVSRLHLPLSLCASAFWIMPTALSQWGSGDAIDLGLSAKLRPVACVGGMAAPVRRSTAGWSMMSAPTQIISPPTGGKFMPENQMSDRLTVLVTFEIDRRQMTILELEKIAAGAVLDMAGLDDDAAVRIRANGVQVASGRLVEANGRIAVQISEMT